MYYFTISGTDLDTINNTSGSTSKQIRFDRGLSRSVKFRVLTATFGDGYEQRAKDGINTKDDTFNATFNNRLASEIKNISGFFDLYRTKSFAIVMGTETIKVVCDSYEITYQYEEVQSISASFRRVYEP